MTPISAIAIKKERGFTLIELVMVIVILGILAAFALPRFANLGGEARAASLTGALGAVRSSSSIAHSKALAQGVVDGDIQLEGTTITMANGYPNSPGIIQAAQLSSDFTTDPASPTAGDPVDVQLGSCSFTYTEAAASGAPTISDVTGQNGNGGCDGQ